MSIDPAHTTFMRRALALARRGWGKTHPNPMVGALIVEEGKVVAEGWHEKAGEAHAEVAALKALGRDPKPGATLYVTLEPCSTEGKTPPCTEAILQTDLSAHAISSTGTHTCTCTLAEKERSRSCTYTFRGPWRCVGSSPGEVLCLCHGQRYRCVWQAQGNAD